MICSPRPTHGDKVCKFDTFTAAYTGQRVSRIKLFTAVCERCFSINCFDCACITVILHFGLLNNNAWDNLESRKLQVVQYWIVGPFPWPLFPCPLFTPSLSLVHRGPSLILPSSAAGVHRLSDFDQEGLLTWLMTCTILQRCRQRRKFKLFCCELLSGHIDPIHVSLGIPSLRTTEAMFTMARADSTMVTRCPGTCQGSGSG
jgi:hypothetical protein